MRISYLTNIETEITTEDESTLNIIYNLAKTSNSIPFSPSMFGVSIFAIVFFLSRFLKL